MPAYLTFTLLCGSRASICISSLTHKIFFRGTLKLENTRTTVKKNKTLKHY